MTTTQILLLILSSLTSYGSALLVILGVFLGIGVAYLIFKFGFKQLKLGSDTQFSGDGTKEYRVYYVEGKNGSKAFY